MSPLLRITRPFPVFVTFHNVSSMTWKAGILGGLRTLRSPCAGAPQYALRSVSGVVRPVPSTGKPEESQEVRKVKQRSVFWKCAVLLFGGVLVGHLYFEKHLHPLIQQVLTSRWDYEWDSSWRPQYEKSANAPVLATGESPQSTKQILLVRHGQYENPWGIDDDRQGLTELGREQAHLTGQYLASVLKGKKIRGIFHSDMKRARETAAIIADYFKGIPVTEDALLAEAVPAAPEPPSSTFHPTDIEINLGAARIEAAFRKYFYRSPPPERLPAYEDEFDVYDVVVCHALSVVMRDLVFPLLPSGNVIRYMFCRALQFPPSAWLRLATYNCGITWINIDNEGYVSAREFGNVGFIPPAKVTYS